MIFDIRRDLDGYAVKEEPDYNLQMIYGMFTAINPKTAIYIGGLKPTLFSDGFLTNDLRWYSGGWIKEDQWCFKKGYYSIFPLSIDENFVHVNSQKEINNLKNGKEAFAHWSDTREHEKLSGTGRGIIDKDTNHPEFKKITESNIVAALNKAWLFMYRFRPTDEVEITDKEIRHSKRLVRLLAEKGIYIKSALVQQKIESPYDLEKNEGDFFIRRIDEIIIKPKKS